MSRVWRGLCFVVLLTGCTGATDDNEGLTFRDQPCDFDLPSVVDDARCGLMRTGDGIELHAAVFAATGSAPQADPILFLGGGPGAAVLGNYTDQYANALETLLEDRDVVFYDQRGTGKSEPGLYCPEYDDAFVDLLADPLTSEEHAQGLEDALAACHDRLVAEGVDIAAYTSAESANDMVSLMDVLGHDTFNIYGISYGTRLALTAMRDHPASIRSVILDSVVPLEEHLIANTSRDFENSLEALFANCAADDACNTAFPDLETTLFDVVDALNADPPELLPVDPATGETFPLYLTGDRLLVGLFQALYSKEFIPLLPLIIDAAANDDFSVLTAGLGGLIGGGTAWGMYYSVECNEEAPFLTDAIVESAKDGVRPAISRVLSDTVGTANIRAVCDFWTKIDPAANEDEPVLSDIPTLVLAGEYDPVTPSYYGQQVADTLSDSQFFYFTGFGHGLVRTDSGESTSPRCAVAMSRDFYNEPSAAVDASCMDDIPPLEFSTP